MPGLMLCQNPPTSCVLTGITGRCLKLKENLGISEGWKGGCCTLTDKDNGGQGILGRSECEVI